MNVQHISIDAANYGVIQGIEHLLDVHDGPSHAPINHFWMQAIAETASQNGAGGLLTGLFGNASVSWPGNGSALLALLQGYPATAFRLFLHAESNPWLTLKRQVLRPLLNPGLKAINRFRDSGKNSWRSYSAINLHMASELNINGRMQEAAYDPTYSFSPLEDIHPSFFLPDFGIGVSIPGEIAVMHSLYNLDPTSNLPMLEFLLRVPDNQFRHGDEGSWLFRRAFQNRMPEIGAD